MNYAEILKKLRELRNEKMAAMTTLHKAASDEARTFTEEENARFSNLERDVQGLDNQIKSTETMERLAGAGAQPVTNNQTDEGADTTTQNTNAGQTKTGVRIRNGAHLQVVRNLPKGTAFTRYAMALASSKGNLVQAVEIAKGWDQSTPEVGRVLKAAVVAGNTTDSAWAAPLVDYSFMSSEFIELLRPATIVGQMAGVRNVPFNIRIPRQTSGASVAWVGQGNPKPVSKQQFDTVTMPESKIAGIVVITMELARFSSPSAEQLVRDDMIEAIAAYTDVQFINPGVAAESGTNPASITNGATAAASTGSTLAEIEADLLAARLALVNNNVSLTGAYWVMNPSTKIFLEELRTTQDVLAFPSLGINGTLKGIKVIPSTSVGTYDSDGAGAGTAKNYISLVSAPNVLLADDGQVMLDASSEASLSMTDDGSGTTMTSLWQRNMIGLRAERMLHWLRRRSNSVYTITDVTY